MGGLDRFGVGLDVDAFELCFGLIWLEGFFFGFRFLFLWSRVGELKGDGKVQSWEARESMKEKKIKVLLWVFLPRC